MGERHKLTSGSGQSPADKIAFHILQYKFCMFKVLQKCVIISLILVPFDISEPRFIRIYRQILAKCSNVQLHSKIFTVWRNYRTLWRQMAKLCYYVAFRNKNSHEIMLHAVSLNLPASLLLRICLRQRDVIAVAHQRGIDSAR